MRISTPSVRAASTKPGRGDRLAGGGRVAEAVAARRAGVVGGDRSSSASSSASPSSSGSGSSSSSSSFSSTSLVDGLVLCVAVAVLGRLLVGGDQLGEHPGERVHLVAAQLGAGGESRRLLGEDAVEAEHERVADAPLAATASRRPASISASAASSACRNAVPGARTTAGSSSGDRNGSPAHASARRAAAAMPSGPSEVVAECVSVSCNARGPFVMPHL